MSNDDHPLIQKNTNLKLQLVNICQQVDDYLAKTHQPTFNDKATPIKSNYELTTTVNWLNQIDKYKQGINEMKHQMQCNHMHIQTINNENALKEQKRVLIALKKEYDTLNNIKAHQDEGLQEIENLHNAKTELVVYSSKLKNTKEEYKLMKDYNKGLIQKIKQQDKQIIELNDYLKLIKDNIENKKRKEEILNKGGNSSSGNNDNVNGMSVEDEIKEMKVQVKELQRNHKEEEKNYLQEINKQTERLRNIINDTDIIEAKLKHVKQNIKISELHYKELINISNYLKEGRDTTNKSMQIKPKRIVQDNYNSSSNGSGSKINNVNYKSVSLVSHHTNNNNNNTISSSKDNVYNNYYYNHHIISKSDKRPFIIKSFNQQNNNNNVQVLSNLQSENSINEYNNNVNKVTEEKPVLVQQAEELINELQSLKDKNDNEMISVNKDNDLGDTVKQYENDDEDIKTNSQKIEGDEHDGAIEGNDEYQEVDVIKSNNRKPFDFKIHFS